MTNAPRKSPPRRGFFLIEMLGYVVVMAAISILVIDIINIMVGATRQATQRDTMIQRVDTALDALRRDTWNAAALADTADGAALTLPDGAVAWQMRPDSTLVRTAPDGTRRTWIDMPALHFSAVGPLLRVGVESGPGGTKHEQIVLASQRLLATGRGGNP
jgi:type II secretory pathway component PulJ